MTDRKQRDRDRKIARLKARDAVRAMVDAVKNESEEPAAVEVAIAELSGAIDVLCDVLEALEEQLAKQGLQ